MDGKEISNYSFNKKKKKKNRQLPSDKSGHEYQPRRMWINKMWIKDEKLAKRFFNLWKAKRFSNTHSGKITQKNKNKIKTKTKNEQAVNFGSKTTKNINKEAVQIHPQEISTCIIIGKKENFSLYLQWQQRNF